MYERIKKLAEQAGFIDFTVHNRIESKEQVLEKFAQLIVQECIEIVEYKGRKIGTKHPVGFNLMDAAWDIKEHFGVEE
jgi:hypothetical protein